MGMTITVEIADNSSTKTSIDKVSFRPKNGIGNQTSGFEKYNIYDENV